MSKAARDFTASFASAYRLSTRKVTLSDDNTDFSDLDRLLLKRRGYENCGRKAGIQHVNQQFQLHSMSGARTCEEARWFPYEKEFMAYIKLNMCSVIFQLVTESFRLRTELWFVIQIQWTVSPHRKEKGPALREVTGNRKSRREKWSRKTYFTCFNFIITWLTINRQLAIQRYRDIREVQRGWEVFVCRWKGKQRTHAENSPVTYDMANWFHSIS
jgi:hypothetical protein